MDLIEIPEISGDRIKKEKKEETRGEEDFFESFALPQMDQLDPSALPLILQVFHHDDILEEPDRILIIYLIPSDINDVSVGVAEDGRAFQINFTWPFLTRDEIF